MDPKPFPNHECSDLGTIPRFHMCSWCLSSVARTNHTQQQLSQINFDHLAYQGPYPGLMEDSTNANGRQTLMCVTDL